MSRGMYIHKYINKSLETFLKTLFRKEELNWKMLEIKKENLRRLFKILNLIYGLF